MTIDVVIPALRQTEVERLVYSLEEQTRRPDTVSIVSNEIDPFPSSMNVRILRFNSRIYAVGFKDVALRQNVGIFESQADHILISGDDQIAPPTMIEDSLRVLETEPFLWGHHRIIDFNGLTVDQVRMMPMVRGHPRETPVNYGHAYTSCYGGMFASRRYLLWDMGGFDMAYMCRHAGEDQQLGYRLMRRHNQPNVFIHEPPFSWMSGSRAPWGPPRVANVCRGEHMLMRTFYGGLPFDACERCPFLVFVGQEKLLLRERPIIPYDHKAVTVRSERWQQP